MTKDPNFSLGVAFLAIGVALAISLDPWFVGLAFLFIGAHRLYAAYAASTDDEASTQE